MNKAYRGSGSASYPPATLLSGADLWLCHRRVFEPQAGASDLRFGGVSLHRGERPPRHDTIATFRRRFLKEIEALFVEVLKLAREMGVLKLGTVALDGTKIHANASRHSALSYEHASKIETQLKAEVAELLAKAEAAESSRCS